MNIKLLLISILAVFMLVAISYATAVNTKTSEIDAKESPLYSIRVKRTIGEKISNMIENIKVRFLGEKIFFLPFYRFTNFNNDVYEGRMEFAKCLGGYTEVKLCTYKDSPVMTCIFTVGSCCPTGIK